MLLFTDLSYQTDIDLNTNFYEDEYILGYTPDDSEYAVLIMQYFPYIKAEIDENKNITSIKYFKNDEQKKSERRTEILARLDEIDSETIRPLRAKISGTATSYDEEKLIRLEAEANILRTELANL